MVIAESGEFLLESGTDFGIRNPDIGNLKPRYVECFTRRRAKNDLFSCFLIDSCKRNMFVTGIGKIGVNFIGNNFYVMADTNICIGFQFFFCPYPSGRVMGRTENGKLYLIFCNFSFHVCKINFIAAVFQNQRTVDQFSFVIFYGKSKRVVNGAVNENGLIFFCQCFDSKVDGRNDTGRFDQPFRFCVPLEIVKKPVMNGFEIRGFCFRIPVNGMIYPLLQGFGDACGNREIHVGNPKGKQVFRLAFFFGKVEFHRVCIFSVNDDIKIGKVHKASFSNDKSKCEKEDICERVLLACFYCICYF